MPHHKDHRVQNFTRTVYLGHDPHTAVMLKAIQHAQLNNNFTRDETDLLRQVYIRLLWADNWHVNFHAEANKRTTGYKTHISDHPAGHIPEILRK